MEHEQQKQTRQMEPSVIPCLGSVAFTFVFVLSTLNVTASERILMLPASIGSHLLQMNSVAEGLIGRGHEVHTILNSRTKVAKGVLNPQKQTQLMLYDVSKVLSTPMPLSPNVVNVGGLNVRKSKPLPEGELKQFVDSATDGFILVSFGSFAKYFPDRIICILLETFRDVPHKIVWKWDKQLLKDDQVLPSNVLAASWLPQNDVLGHENIKLFVTHCGNSGQHEALYHGIPMVGFPLFGDQMFNCKRVEGRFGRHIRAKDLTQEKLLNMIKHVISDRKYSDNIGKASAVFRDEAMEPRDTAAYWIDHVIKHGANHLRSQTNEMSWIQLLMWDVLFVLCAVVAVVMTLLFFVCRCLYRSCYRGLSSKEKAKQS
ncbi:UDP-glucosyltransferase 2-like isoform X2 [Lineus longissimus]|uniref:UDP-glucosyltransferase 2-like isoform X2 n=1 Tax=Lineus longissimus TaxID=88925 RepID=UPI002B4D10FA